MHSAECIIRYNALHEQKKFCQTCVKYLLTHASECNMRFILRVIFFPQLFARARSASANNRKENDEQNKSHIAREACVNKFIVRQNSHQHQMLEIIETYHRNTALLFILKIKTPQNILIKHRLLCQRNALCLLRVVNFIKGR